MCGGNNIGKIGGKLVTIKVILCINPILVNVIKAKILSITFIKINKIHSKTEKVFTRQSIHHHHSESILQHPSLTYF